MGSVTKAVHRWLSGFLVLFSVILGADPAIGAMSEVWTARYDAASLVAGEDADGDGATNGEEASSGTDPFDSMSRVRASIVTMTDTQALLEVSSQPGKRYRVWRASSPSGPWEASGMTVSAADETLQLWTWRSDNREFYRVLVSDKDSDGDGLSDWDELQFAGFDPDNDDSFATGTPNSDYTIASEMLQAVGAGLVTANVPSPAAYEKEGTPAIVTISRDTSSVEFPITVFLHVSGGVNPTKSSASASDYVLKDGDGNPVGRRLVIPAGASSAALHIVPIADNLPEVPEEIHLSIGAAEVAVVTVRDAIPTPDNQSFFLATLRPVFGTGSAGSGFAVVRLPGDNDIATIALAFSNLNSPVSSTEVLAGDGTLFLSVPASGYASQAWPIRASGLFPTDQSVLDGLWATILEVAIKTDSRPAGEVKGHLLVSAGSTEFQPPPDPAPIEPLADAALDREIIRFLTQATFGPTMADVIAMQSLVASHSGDRIAAFGEWIDQQFAMPSPSLLDYAIAADRQEIEIRAMLPPEHPEYNPTYNPSYSNRLRGWWLLARHAPDQLRERSAFALSEILVISDHDPVILARPYGAAHFYDMLRSGSSGSYRDLLEGVARHPIMGQYLSLLRGEKGVLDGDGNVIVFPDENFAREVMQLFSIGLAEQHPDGSLKLGPGGLPIPTYDLEDVTEISRALTGWSFGTVNSPETSDTVIANTNFYHGNGVARHEAQWTHPMVVFPDHHDQGPKTVLDLTIPEGQSGEQDLSDILDLLASHPNTAPFLSLRLIQRFVTANPSAGYVYRVSDAFTASGGNLAATVKAILLDPEARSLDASLNSSGVGKKREPLLRFLAFLRAFDGKTQHLLSDLADYGYPATESAMFPAGITRVRLGSTNYWLSQSPQSAPSVFNWFPPGHIPGGLLGANGLKSPEFKLANANSVFQETNFLYYLSFSSISTTKLPGQELPPYNYSSTAGKLTLDIAPLEALYMGVVDTNGDGLFTSLDSGTFGNTSSIAAACEAVLDRIDFLLCAGSLKARYGSTAGQPRRVILDTMSSIQSANNYVNHATNQVAYMRDRIRNALWLVMSSPDFVIQK